MITVQDQGDGRTWRRQGVWRPAFHWGEQGWRLLPVDHQGWHQPRGLFGRDNAEQASGLGLQWEPKKIRQGSERVLGQWHQRGSSGAGGGEHAFPVDHGEQEGEASGAVRAAAMGFKDPLHESWIHQVGDGVSALLDELLQAWIAVPLGAEVVGDVAGSPHGRGPVQRWCLGEHATSIEAVLLRKLQQVGTVAGNGMAVPVGAQLPVAGKVPDGIDPAAAMEGGAPIAGGPVHADAVGIEIGHPLLKVIAGQPRQELAVAVARELFGPLGAAMDIQLGSKFGGQMLQFIGFEAGMAIKFQAPEFMQGRHRGQGREVSEPAAVEIVGAGEFTEGAHKEGRLRGEVGLEGIEIGVPVPGGFGAVGDGGDGGRVAEEIIQAQPDQIMLQPEGGGNPASHLNIGGLAAAHGDQMGLDALAQHGAEDHPGIKTAGEGKVGIGSRPGGHRLVEGLHGCIGIGRAFPDRVHIGGGLQRDGPIAEQKDAARGNAMDGRMEGGIAGEVLQLAEIAQGRPVPLPGKATVLQDFVDLVAMKEAAILQGVEVVHRPHGGGDDGAGIGLGENECIFTFQIGKGASTVLPEKLPQGGFILETVSKNLNRKIGACWIHLAVRILD